MKQINAACEAYSKTLDAPDADRLAFFNGLWEIQDRHARIVAEGETYEVPDREKSEEWYWQEKPIFMMAPLRLDADQFIAVLEDCSCYLVDNGELKADIAEQLRFFDWRDLVEKSDLSQAGYDPMAYMEACCKINEEQNSEGKGKGESEDHGLLDPNVLVLVMAYGLRPLLEQAAARVMTSLAPALKEGNNIHDKPLKCPMCGGEATAAFIGETPSNQGNGRLLYCGICGTEWEFDRIRCGHCGTRNQGQLHYFHVEGDDAHRLHSCQECGDYMRTVFQADQKVPFSFPVEDVVMTRLDMIANDPRFNREAEENSRI